MQSSTHSLAAASHSAPSTDTIINIIAKLAEKVSILSELSAEYENEYQLAVRTLAGIIECQESLAYCSQMIEAFANCIERGEDSEFIARVLNGLAKLENTDIHLLMLDAKLLPLTLQAFKTRAEAYYALTEPCLNTERQLSQYGILLFNLLKFTTPPTEKLKIIHRDEIRKMLDLDCSQLYHLPLATFLVGINTISSYSMTRDDSRNSCATIPQAALALSGFGFGATTPVSSIENQGSPHSMISDSAPCF